MNNPYIYYKEQCNYCLNKGKCDYEAKTQAVIDIISATEKVAKDVYGTFSFKCDYFALDELAYNKNNPPETCG